jgi:hypothetical protein
MLEWETRLGGSGDRAGGPEGEEGGGEHCKVLRSVDDDDGERE